MTREIFSYIRGQGMYERVQKESGYGVYELNAAGSSGGGKFIKTSILLQ